MPLNELVLNNIRRKQELQDAERQHELNVLTQAVGSGHVGSKDLPNLAAGFQYVTPADLQGLGAWADLNRKVAREREALAPGAPEQLGALTALQPGARPGLTQPASDTANATAGEGLAQLIGSLNGMSPEDQATYVPQLMNRFVAAREATSQKNLADVANEQRAGAQSQINARATQQSGEAVRSAAQGKQGIADALAASMHGLMSPEQLAQLNIAPLEQQPPDIKRLVAGSSADLAKWERSVTGKADPEKIKQDIISADVQDYPGFVPNADYARDVTLEQVGQRVRDNPVLTERLGLPSSAGPQFFRSANQKDADQKIKDREALANLVNIDDQFTQHYGDIEAAQKAGKLAGGPMQTGGMYDALSTLGVQVPEIRVYQADQFNYSMALLRALRQGRVSDADMAYQLRTFPTIAELGTPNGRAKLDARRQFLNDQILAPYSPAVRQQLSQSTKAVAPALTADQKALIAEVRSGKLDPSDPTVVQKFMNTIDSSGTTGGAKGPAAAPAGLVDKY